MSCEFFNLIRFFNYLQKKAFKFGNIYHNISKMLVVLFKNIYIYIIILFSKKALNWSKVTVKTK